MQVLECSWDELLHKVQEAADLDHIIAAHQVFLDTVLCRCLLDEKSRVSCCTHVHSVCVVYVCSVLGERWTGGGAFHNIS